MLIRGDNMELSYNNLWKILIDKKMKKGTLCQEAEISTSVLARIYLALLPLTRKWQ